MANNKYFKKLANGDWEFIEMKQTSHQKEFKPFSMSAIEKCKERARGRK